jgi:hypothetical protein
MAQMATRNLYIRDADVPLVKRVERSLKKQRMSLSEWFVRQCIGELERLQVQRNGRAKQS